MNNLPSVSIIVPAYNAEYFLEECLRSLCQLDWPVYEVILVDNGSTDATAEMAKKFDRVKYLYFDEVKSSYAARNRAAADAGGEVLVFFDADQYADTSFLQVLLKDFDHRNPRLVYSCRLRDDPRIPYPLRLAFARERLPGKKIETPNGSVSLPPEGAGVMGVPRQLFEELGGFKPHLLSGGDFEFLERAAACAGICFNDEFGASHHWATSTKMQLQRWERYYFGECVRARELGHRIPATGRLLPELAWAPLKFVAKCCLLPLRFHPQEWIPRWQAQVVLLLAKWYKFRGRLKFHRGDVRAGDLPKDATVQLARSCNLYPLKKIEA